MQLVAATPKQRRTVIRLGVDPAAVIWKKLPTDVDLDFIRAVVARDANEVIRQQQAMQNAVEEIRIDGQLQKPITRMTRSLFVGFQGGTDMRPMMLDVQSTVAAQIQGTTWAWVAWSPFPQRQRLIYADMRSGGPVNLRVGEKLYYVPVSFSGNPDPTYRNALAVNGGRGAYANVSRILRSRYRSRGIWIGAYHTVKYVPAGRILPPGVQIGDKTKSRVGKGNRLGMYQGAFGFVISMTRRGAR